MQSHVVFIHPLQVALRALSITLLASVITLALFVLMDLLTRVEHQDVTEAPPGVLIDAIFEPEPQITQEKKPLPPPPEHKPMPKLTTLAPVNDDTQLGIGDFVPDVNLGSELGEIPIFNASEGQATPMVRFDPNYPMDALRDGIEGWVKLAFDIDPSGKVENVRVLESSPARIFDREARRALLRWKYKPQIQNGQAMTQPNQVVLLSFNLNQ